MRNYDEEARSRPEKKYDYEFDAIVRHYMMKTFEPLFVKGPALELGCHEGDSTLLLSRVFDDLTAIEPSGEAIAVAKTKVPASVEFVQGTFETAQIDRKFSTIFLVNTLEHLDDSVLALESIKRFLADDGLLFVLVPNADAPSRQIAVHMGLIETNNAVTEGEWKHGHRRTYSFDTLEADTRKAGLKVRHRGGLMFKTMANFQIDKCLAQGIINEDFIEGMYRLGMVYPSFCASIYLVLSL